MHTPERPESDISASKEAPRQKRREKFFEQVSDDVSEIVAFAKEHPGEEFPASKLREFRISQRVPDFEDPEGMWVIQVDEERKEVRIALFRKDRTMQDAFAFQLPENENRTS